MIKPFPGSHYGIKATIKPYPGSHYVAKQGDTAERIAAIAYGDSARAPEIERANATKKIVVGTILVIPDTVPFIPPAPSTEGLSLSIGGAQVVTESLRISRSLDSLADGWAARLAWTPGADVDFDKRARPYSYTPSHAYIDGEIAISGRLYRTATVLGARRSMDLEGWSLAADMVDSTLQPPFESNKVTLTQRVIEVASVFGLRVFSDLTIDGQFDRVTAGPTEQAGAHLLSLAAQRGVLINSDADGSVRIFTVDSNAPIVGTIEEGRPGFSGFSGDFDGRARFNAYRFFSQTPGETGVSVTAVDNAVPITRFSAYSGNDTTAGEAVKAVEWRRTKALADAMSMPITAAGFRAPSGETWAPGQRVTLISPTLFLPNGFTMLIRSVEMVSGAGGDTTLLGLVPPAVYTGGDIVDPWVSE